MLIRGCLCHSLSSVSIWFLLDFLIPYQFFFDLKQDSLTCLSRPLLLICLLTYSLCSSDFPKFNTDGVLYGSNEENMGSKRILVFLFTTVLGEERFISCYDCFLNLSLRYVWKGNWYQDFRGTLIVSNGNPTGKRWTVVSWMTTCQEKFSDQPYSVVDTLEGTKDPSWSV